MSSPVGSSQVDYREQFQKLGAVNSVDKTPADLAQKYCVNVQNVKLLNAKWATMLRVLNVERAEATTFRCTLIKKEQDEIGKALAQCTHKILPALLRIDSLDQIPRLSRVAFKEIQKSVDVLLTCEKSLEYTKKMAPESGITIISSEYVSTLALEGGGKTIQFLEARRGKKITYRHMQLSDLPLVKHIYTKLDECMTDKIIMASKPDKEGWQVVIFRKNELNLNGNRSSFLIIKQNMLAPQSPNILASSRIVEVSNRQFYNFVSVSPDSFVTDHLINIRDQSPFNRSREIYDALNTKLSNPSMALIAGYDDQKSLPLFKY